MTQASVCQAYRVIKTMCDLVAYDITDTTKVHVFRAVSLEERSLKNTSWELCGRDYQILITQSWETQQTKRITIEKIVHKERKHKGTKEK